jgi:hypothetical protein
LLGEALLVQLGTANPGKTAEEKQRWNDGLRGVLKELRKKSIKDPNGIAVEIAKYRREFLKDDTRVVNLWGEVSRVDGLLLKQQYFDVQLT